MGHDKPDAEAELCGDDAGDVRTCPYLSPVLEWPVTKLWLLTTREPPAALCRSGCRRRRYRSHSHADAITSTLNCVAATSREVAVMGSFVLTVGHLHRAIRRDVGNIGFLAICGIIQAGTLIPWPNQAEACVQALRPVFMSRSARSSWEEVTGCLYWMMTLTSLLEPWSNRLDLNSEDKTSLAARSGSKPDDGAAAMAEIEAEGTEK